VHADDPRKADTVRQLLAILALGLVSVVPGSAPDGSIEDFIDREMPASGVPGLAYAVVADGEMTSVGARGVVKIGGDTEVTPDTPFVIGSISKSFTALAVMQLVEAGKIDLDAEISQHLDVFSGRPAGAITIRQLLSHTSGFSTLQGNGRAAASRGGSTNAKDVLERSVDALGEVTPAYGPGQRWEYSNLNYQILGRLIEVVSGQEFQAYVTANILEPVGMEHSFVADGEIHDSMATGHEPWFTTKRALAENPTHRATAPQGGIIATASDLARYMQMMLNGQDDVLSAAGKAQMMRPASAASPTYGFGWYVDQGNGSVWHTGASPGFESLAWMLPAQKKGAVVLVNAVGGVGFAETTELRTGIAARGLGIDYVGEGSRLPQKALFIGLALLPITYLLSMIWAWRHRAAIRAKSGIAGRFSLWFPLLTTLVAAWVILGLVPRLFGSPLANLNLFLPDFVLMLIATAVTGVLWAVFRLGVAYTGRSATA
jgi:CubicO group peptidase (beta-lactamase class C family)